MNFRRINWWDLLFGRPITPPPPPPALPPTDAKAISEATLVEHNKAREAGKLDPYRHDDKLMIEAQDWAEAMLAQGGMSHAGFQRRLRDAGYIIGSENVAWFAGGSSGPEAVTNAWMSSSGHRANILGPYTHAGFGSVQGRNVYWCGLYARE